MEIAKALFEWLWRRLELPLWPLAAFFCIVLVAAVTLECFRHRAAVAALRTLALQRGGSLVRGWRFWSPVARIGALEISISPMAIRLRASAAGRLWLDTRDIPDRRVKARRGERVRTGDWAFDDAFDGFASSKSFGEACLDGEIRGELLKLDALARRSAPEDEEGNPLRRLRVELDGRRLEVRFRHTLAIEDIPVAVGLLEGLAGRLGASRP